MPTYEDVMASAPQHVKPRHMPAKLVDLMGKRLFNLVLVEAFYLYYEHGLMAFTPAIRTDTNDMAVCLDRFVMEEVSALLDPERRPKTRMESKLFLTNGHEGFFLNAELKGGNKLVQVLNHMDVEQLCMSRTEPFRWYPNVA